MDSPDLQWMDLFLALIYRDLMKGERICNFFRCLSGEPYGAKAGTF